MDLNKLRTILSKPEYAGTSNAQAAQLANQKRHEKVVETRMTYLGVAAKLGTDLTKKLISTLDTLANTDVLIREIRSDLKGGGFGIDVGHPVTRGLLDQIAAANTLPLKSADVNLIKGLAVILESDADRVGLGPVEEKDVRLARTL